MKVFKFSYVGLVFDVEADNVLEAFGKANDIVQNGIGYEGNFAWFDGVDENSFFIQFDVLMD